MKPTDRPTTTKRTKITRSEAIDTIANYIIRFDISAEEIANAITPEKIASLADDNSSLKRT